MNHSFKITISGRVQGVGFRPFVYNLASKFELTGCVSNNESGVVIVVNGNKERALKLHDALKKKCPKNAEIISIKISDFLTTENFETFYIKPTEKNISVNLPLTPDFAICESCKEEITDSENKRYFYPFTTCTQCGPRYSVTKKFPFERENTSMNEFEMCQTCTEEYRNPEDIRFHSQTNSCPDCGVQISFTDKENQKISGTNLQIFRRISDELKQGKIIAVKNISGYLLICDATNPKFVEELRKRKKRLAKPFAVLFPNFSQIITHLSCNEFEEQQLKSAEAPIVILDLKSQNDLAIDKIAPRMETIGAMLPNSGILQLISFVFNKPLVATSGNIHGVPICGNEKEAIEALNPIADFFLHHNLDVQHPQDDSVVKFSERNKAKIILRRSRGFAPNFKSDFLNESNQKILCLGGDLKNTITISPNNQCYISEYIGDLSNYDTYNRFEKKVEDYLFSFNFSPEIIITDKHPNYQNHQIIKDLVRNNYKPEIIKIQHHEAHFAAILGEKKLWEQSKVLGVIWDGMGFGNENEILGGEFLQYNNRKITRVGHLEYYSWILGDKMSKNPKIAALSISGNTTFFQRFFNENELKIYTKEIELAKIKTSSMGRLFDAVAFALGFKEVISFEGEASLYLENLAQREYNKNILELEDYLKDEVINSIIPARKILFQIVDALKNNINVEIIALNFHYTLVKCIEKVAKFSRTKELAFSGGVFQNAVLIDLIIDHLQPKYKLHFHEIISPNDENISFGQLNYYLQIKK
ncbi:carbamoyltransferase HypF [Flavobacterium hydatis]|uniref:Carbamoyltransferase n=1 Tax=Flavobacterium hydatis TaxID=991 RepID=A0A086AQV3_FLAHY|nr:carbamoyltransferase HypF [Flavobacterium hydatis]KFF19067.1 hypothetical protein IW20_03705 [Flavobacterium hydatis]OXA93597.1 carbamoyltransferase HypF [Flavobacterium hydatis]